MADTYKELHKDWKSAKKDAKRVYEAWDRMYADFSSAHEDVKFSTPRFPKFNLDLGPSLDKLEAKKDVEKYQAKAEKAVKQYAKELKELEKGISKMPERKESRDKLIHKAMVREVETLNAIIKRIDKKLSE